MSEPQGSADRNSDRALTADRTTAPDEDGGGVVNHSLPPIASSTITQPRSVAKRGFSRKLNDLVKLHQKQHKEEAAGTRTRRAAASKEKFEPKNWKALTAQQLSKMTAMERSRYLVYEPPSKDVADKQMEALKRVRERKQQQRRLANPTLMELIETEENSELVGQLKAAQAYWRITTSGDDYETNQTQELLHLVSSQPTAMEAIRLQNFIPTAPKYVVVPDRLSQLERARCEALLEDQQGLITARRS